MRLRESRGAELTNRYPFISPPSSTRQWFLRNNGIDVFFRDIERITIHSPEPRSSPRLASHRARILAVARSQSAEKIPRVRFSPAEERRGECIVSVTAKACFFLREEKNSNGEGWSIN